MNERMNMDFHTIRLRVKVLLRHPSLIPKFWGGRTNVSRLHIEIELKRTRALYDAFAKSGIWGITEDVAKAYRKYGIPRNEISRPRSYLRTLGVIERFFAEICHTNAFLYAICRMENPTLVVETGVRRGESTAFILQALQDNANGQLYSIDLPDFGRYYRDSTDTGFLVRPDLRSRWHLSLGDSKVELPSLLGSLGSIDLFHHDSLHTYDQMTFEFEQAWGYIRDGGLLISDDVDRNPAFSDFCKRRDLMPIIIRGSGFVRKGSERP